MVNEYSISSLTIVTPDEIKDRASLRVNDGKISGFGKSAKRDIKLDDSYLLFPALINIHDHLFGTYYPKIGNGPYLCWLPWDYDLKNSPVYSERNKNQPFDIYLLGSYKNLISGVTTVQDHIPHKVNEPFIDKLPIRVIKDYALSHEVSAYDLKWGDGLDIEYERAVRKKIPYITHIEEGFDVESLRGVEILEQHNALSEYTILIHGIGFSERDIETIARYNVNFVWCPGSNMFMFNRTAKIKEIIENGVNVSIGTDSPATGELNILEEIRFAKKVYREMYGEDISDKTIVKMITENPARALKINDSLGTLESGKLADLLIIRRKSDDPYKSLVEVKLEDIALITMEGIPLYGDIHFAEFFYIFKSDDGKKYEEININGSSKFIVGSPTSLMERIRRNVGYNKEIPFLPI